MRRRLQLQQCKRRPQGSQTSYQMLRLPWTAMLR